MGKKIAVAPETIEATEQTLFCKYQLATAENPNGTDCAIWIIEGKAALTGLYECPYISAEHAQQGNAFSRAQPVSAGGDGVCRDFTTR